MVLNCPFGDSQWLFTVSGFIILEVSRVKNKIFLTGESEQPTLSSLLMRLRNTFDRKLEK